MCFSNSVLPMSRNDDRSCSCSGVAFFLEKGFMRPRLLCTISSNPADSIAVIWALTLVAVFLSLALVVKKEVGIVSVFSLLSSGKI